MRSTSNSVRVSRICHFKLQQKNDKLNENQQ